MRQGRSNSGKAVQRSKSKVQSRKPNRDKGKSKAPATARTRVCTKCGREKPLSEFPPHKGYRYNRLSWCRACCNAYAVQYRHKHLDRIRARDRRCWHKRKEKQAERERQPDVKAKRAIRQAVYWAVKAGAMEKPETCQRCGAQPPPHRLHAHHPDYSKPLDVVWLCSLCHGREHTLANAERGTRKAERKRTATATSTALNAESAENAEGAEDSRG